MAFDITNSIRYTGVETADTAFSKVLIKNLFKNSTFKPGETFTNKYYERAGQIMIRRLGKTAVTKKDATASGGLDFTHTQTADKLLTIVQKDALSRSEKIYALIDELRASGKSVDKVAEVVAEWTEGFNVQCMSYLLATPSETGGGATRSANTTASTDSKTLIQSILNDRKQISISGGNADVIIISPDAEEFLLTDWATGKGFIPETNEEALKEGKIGRIFGMNVYVSNLIGAGTPLDPGVAANTGDAATTEYIIYDHDTFGIASTVEGLRLVEDDKTFVGSFAQIMSIMGGIVANPALAIAKVVDEDAGTDDTTMTCNKTDTIIDATFKALTLTFSNSLEMLNGSIATATKLANFLTIKKDGELFTDYTIALDTNKKVITVTASENLANGVYVITSAANMVRAAGSDLAIAAKTATFTLNVT